MIFSKDYPFELPQIEFVDDIKHPLVDPVTRRLNCGQWKSLELLQILYDVQEMLVRDRDFVDESDN